MSTAVLLVSGPAQHTGASGLYINPPVVSVTLAAGSYNVTAMVYSTTITVETLYLQI